MRAVARAAARATALLGIHLASAVAGSSLLTAEHGYDCEAGRSNWEAGWSEAKKVWCCEAADVGCPFDCDAAYSNWRAAWSPAKKMWCCENKGLACEMPSTTSVPFDCQADYADRFTVWTTGKQEWCCEHKQLGCPTTAAPTITSTTFTTTTMTTTETLTTTVTSTTSTETATNTRTATTTKTATTTETETATTTVTSTTTTSRTSTPTTTSTVAAFDCIAGYATWRESWSAERQEWCCEKVGRACQSLDPTTVTTSATTTTITATTTGTSTTWTTVTHTQTTTSSTATSTSTVTTTATATTTKTSTTVTSTTWTTTSTVTSTSTTTTTAGPCFDEQISWEPLDMPNTLPVHEPDVRACQERCANTTGCTHFSYWTLGGHCHLQDAYAIMQTGRLGFVSGPFRCWSSLNHRLWVDKGNKTYVHKGYKCVEFGTLFSPILGVPKYFPRSMDGRAAVKACREYCISVPGCAHFTIQFPQRGCRLAAAGAHKLHNFMNAVSGTPTCWRGEDHTAANASAAAEVIIRADLPQRLLAKGRPATSATAGLAALAVALTALAAGRAARRGGLPELGWCGPARPSPAYLAVESYADADAGVLLPAE